MQHYEGDNANEKNKKKIIKKEMKIKNLKKNSSA